jgi:peptidylprolyl isomerase
MQKRALGLCLALAVISAGCNETMQKSTSTSSESTSATTSPVPSGSADVSGGKMHKLASGLQYEDVVVGSGKMAEPGMQVSVHYTGTLTDGTKFDSSLDRGQPIQFQLGAGRVIQGWEEGIKGMRIGGKRKLVIPPDLGYGANGGGPIPPNATLLFDVELVDVK